MRKSIRTLALVIAAVLCIGAVSVFGAGAVTENGLTYLEKNGGLILYSAGSGLSGGVEIPSAVDGLSVIEIEKNVFANATKLEYVKIPASVVKIGENAFSGCPMLESVVFEKSDETVTLGERVFSDCPSLKNLVLPQYLKNIPAGAFSGCALPSVTIPDGVKIIGVEAFLDNRSMVSATIPASVTSIGNHAFYGCRKLQSFNVADDNAYFCGADGCLYTKDKTKLIQYGLGKPGTEFTVPAGVTEIGSGAFAFSSLKKVILPEGLETIGYGAFADNTSLFSVEFPSTLTEICESAFYRCLTLKSITIPATVEEYRSAFAFSGLESVRIMSGVKEIPVDAFTGCASIKGIVIPDNVTEIKSAFLDCTSLREIWIPASVTAIADDCFSGCTDLTIVAPKGSFAEQYAVRKGFAFRASSSQGDDEISKIVISSPNGIKDIRWKYKAHLIAKADLPKGYRLVWYKGKDRVSTGPDYTTGMLTANAEYTARIETEDGKPVSTSAQEKPLTLNVKDDFFTKIISFFVRLFGGGTQVFEP